MLVAFLRNRIKLTNPAYDDEQGEIEVLSVGNIGAV
jgi:hypothetical protein